MRRRRDEGAIKKKEKIEEIRKRRRIRLEADSEPESAVSHPGWTKWSE